MNINMLLDGAVELIILGYIIARQLQARVVTLQALRIPVVMGVILGVLFFYNAPTPGNVVAVVCGVALGLLSGFIGAQFIRVQRRADGAVYQQGDWRYIVTLLAFIALRIVARFALGHMLNPTALNDAFIAVIVGNYLGRASGVLLRAVSLAGQRLSGIPYHSPSRS